MLVISPPEMHVEGTDSYHHLWQAVYSDDPLPGGKSLKQRCTQLLNKFMNNAHVTY